MKCNQEQVGKTYVAPTAEPITFQDDVVRCSVTDASGEKGYDLSKDFFGV